MPVGWHKHPVRLSCGDIRASEQPLRRDRRADLEDEAGGALQQVLRLGRALLGVSGEADSIISLFVFIYNAFVASDHFLLLFAMFL